MLFESIGANPSEPNAFELLVDARAKTTSAVEKVTFIITLLRLIVIGRNVRSELAVKLACSLFQAFGWVAIEGDDVIL